ncbi:MAG: YlqD family protein [bacterium]
MNKIKLIIQHISNLLTVSSTKDRGENMEINTIRVKRPIKIKTIVTDKFKQQVQEEINKEINLLDSQIMQLEMQSKQIHDQASEFSSLYGDHSVEQIQQALEDISRRLQQISELKNEMVSQKESISHLALNNVIITGSLENYVELRTGENIYEKFREAEILVKDGVIQEIKE